MVRGGQTHIPYLIVTYTTGMPQLKISEVSKIKCRQVVVGFGIFQRHVDLK